MTPLIVFIRPKKFETALSCCRSTDYACRKARLEEQEFYDRNGGLGQRILYWIISAPVWPLKARWLRGSSVMQSQCRQSSRPG